MNRWLQLLSVVSFLALATGCGDSRPALVPVSGTIQMEEGSLPQGEIMDIHFEPATPGPDTKLATGKIEKDGSFKLSTLEPNDGAYPGDYKVVVSIWKTYLGREDLLAPEFGKAETTPLKATVKPGSQTFTFKVH